MAGVALAGVQRMGPVAAVVTGEATGEGLREAQAGARGQKAKWGMEGAVRASAAQEQARGAWRETAELAASVRVAVAMGQGSAAAAAATRAGALVMAEPQPVREATACAMFAGTAMVVVAAARVVRVGMGQMGTKVKGWADRAMVTRTVDQAEQE